MNHTPEKLDKIIEMVHRHTDNVPWITDIDKLNTIYRAAREVVARPDKFHLEVLAQAIKEAKDG